MLGRVTVVLTLLMVLMTPPALAHTKDLVKAGARSGVIRLNKSTVGDVKRWFGAPRFTGSINILGCKLKGATWGKSFKRPKLVVYSRKKNPKVKTATFCKRVIQTETQGTLKPHTGKGLRIGDSLKKLKRLYPKAESVKSDPGKRGR